MLSLGIYGFHGISVVIFASEELDTGNGSIFVNPLVQGTSAFGKLLPAKGLPRFAGLLTPFGDCMLT